jgi:hypothetical protein
VKKISAARLHATKGMSNTRQASWLRWWCLRATKVQSQESTRQRRVRSVITPYTVVNEKSRVTKRDRTSVAMQPKAQIQLALSTPNDAERRVRDTPVTVNKRAGEKCLRAIPKEMPSRTTKSRNPKPTTIPSMHCSFSHDVVSPSTELTTSNE